MSRFRSVHRQPHRDRGIGTDPSQANSLATEVSRDFFPPCPARISPAAAAALGPATLLGCGTLAANSMTPVKQTTCQTSPDANAHAVPVTRDLRPDCVKAFD